MTIREKLAKALIWLGCRVGYGFWPAGVRMLVQPPEHIAAKMYAEQRERARRVIDQALAAAGVNALDKQRMDLMQFPDLDDALDLDRRCPTALHRGTMQDPFELPAITTKPITEVN